MTLKYGEVFLVNCGLSGVPSIEVPSFQGLEGVSPDSLFTQDPPPLFLQIQTLQWQQSSFLNFVPRLLAMTFRLFLASSLIPWIRLWRKAFRKPGRLLLLVVLFCFVFVPPLLE